MTAAEKNEDTVRLRHVQTIDVPYDEAGSRYRLSLTKAVRTAGLDKNSVVQYLPEKIETLGVVPVVEVEDSAKTPSDCFTYNIFPGGGKGRARRLQIPEKILAALDIDTGSEMAQDDDLPPLDVYAGDRVLAFGKASANVIPANLLPARITSNDEDVTLRQAQTTTPRVHTGTVIAAITRAFNKAGGNFETVEFRPELADRLDGFVPAIEADGESGSNIRSIYRQGPDKQGAAVSLPENVLAALNLSIDDYEDRSSSERPALTVYAGEKMICFGLTGQRDIVLECQQTQQSEHDRGRLTDIDGIGSVLADRLSRAGFTSIADLADATDAELLDIDGLGKHRTARIMASIPKHQ